LHISEAASRRDKNKLHSGEPLGSGMPLEVPTRKSRKYVQKCFRNQGENSYE
jgi:hypothetical protein